MKRRFMGRLAVAVAVLAITLAASAPASAAVIDLTMSPLTLGWTGSVFTASGSTVFFTWVGPTPGSTQGTVDIYWDGAAGLPDKFKVVDTAGGLGTMLEGTVSGFDVLYFGSGVGTFAGTAGLTESDPALAMGNLVRFEIGGTQFGTGTTSEGGEADVRPIPEPATLGLVGIGFGALAARRRRSRR